MATKRYFRTSSRINSISASRFEAHTSRISIVLPSGVLKKPLAELFSVREFLCSVANCPVDFSLPRWKSFAVIILKKYFLRTLRYGNYPDEERREQAEILTPVDPSVAYDFDLSNWGVAS